MILEKNEITATLGQGKISLTLDGNKLNAAHEAVRGRSTVYVLVGRCPQGMIAEKRLPVIRTDDTSIF